MTADRAGIVGRHLVAEVTGVAPAHLSAPEVVCGALEAALRQAGFTILETVCHRFAGGGQGFTALFLLAESHCSVHTYPELDYLAFDLFSCGDKEPGPVLDALLEVLGAVAPIRTEVPRRRPLPVSEPSE